MVIATALGWHDLPSILLAVVLAFFFGNLLLLVPGAMAAGLLDPLFWGSLAVSLLVAFVVTLPVNRWLIAGSVMPLPARTTLTDGRRGGAAEGCRGG